MVVYHGSDNSFKKLRISSSLVKRRSTEYNEGLGIYFSTDKEVARSYGKYIYTLQINDNYFVDFRIKGNCQKYIMLIRKRIYDETGINIAYYTDLSDTYNRIYWGGLAVSGIGRELYMILDSTANFYKLPKSKIESIYRLLRGFDRKPPKAYMFNYSIKNIGVIKDVGDDIVRVINKEQSY